MAGIPAPNEEQGQRKQSVLDYFCDHLDQPYTAEQVAEATGVGPEDVKIALETLAYEKELVKERPDGGQTVYRRKA